MQWDDLKNRKTDFDEMEPEKGHLNRFEDRLKETFSSHEKKNFLWLRIAAIFVLSFGILWFLNNGEKPIEIAENTTEQNDESIPIEEAEYYYKNAFSKKIELLAKENTSPESKTLIEESNQMILDLDNEYLKLVEELERTGDQRVAVAMINNYKSRIKILEALILKIKYINQLKKENDENISA